MARSCNYMNSVCRRLLIMLALCAVLQPAGVLAAGFKLSIAPTGNKVVITWSTNAASYVLQSITNLYSTNWLTITNPAPVVANTNNSVTYTNNSSARYFRLFLNTNIVVSSYAGMIAIPGGTFTMGDVADTNLNHDAAPISVTVSGYYMDTNLVTSNLWQSVYNVAVSAGYTFDTNGAAKAANHPVESVNWYDVVKWCNARSVQAGLMPVYYTDAGLTQVYTNGDVDAVYVNWSTNGFRLPTEAEWERAARAGLSSQRFPWGSTISESQANYFGYPSSAGGYYFDLGPYFYNSAGYSGSQPYTTPVGSFAPNGYGLNDMAGNVIQWCWDWYAGSPYPAGSPYLGGTDPRGPASSPSGARVARGGDWGGTAIEARCANRSDSTTPSSAGFSNIGFRCVRAH
jgi:sulfatase modifying factor 1